MYYRPFFPSAEFAWAFLLLLSIALAVAAYIDWRKTIIPKWVTLGMLGLGVLVSVVRGAWLGAQGVEGLLDPGNTFLGAVYGLLCALVGILAGFLMLFVLWILGTCGGGDVKLFAAVSAWLGPLWAVFVLAASLLVLFVEVVVKIISAGGLKALKPPPKEQKKKNKPGSWRVTYSLPVAIATVAVVLWFFRVELRLAKPSPAPSNNPEVRANAR